MKKQVILPMFAILMVFLLLGLSSAWADNSRLFKRTISAPTGTIINLTYDPNMNSDFSDIEFYNTAETQKIPYWIESFVASDSAIVHLADNDSLGFIYYGNSTATSQSDITNVYLGLKAYYPIDNSNFSDVFGSGDVTGLNGVFTNGKILGAYRPNIDNAVSGLTLGSTIGSDNSWTMTFYLNSTQTLTGGNVYEGTGLLADGTYFFSPTGFNQMQLFVRAGGILYSVNTDQLPLASYTLLIWTYNGTTLNAYQDGILETTTEVTGFVADSVNAIQFFNFNGGFHVDGQDSDDFRFYNHSLSTQEISDLQNKILVSSFSLGSEINITPSNPNVSSISVELVSPLNNAVVNSPVSFNANLNLINFDLSNATLLAYNSTNSLILQDTKTESGNVSISESWSESFASGNYTWNVLLCTTNSTCVTNETNASFQVVPVPPFVPTPPFNYHLIGCPTNDATGICLILNSAGAGLGLFIYYVGQSIGLLIIGLAIVGIILLIGYGIAHIIRNSLNKPSK